MFGIKESDVKETCILMPLAARESLRRFGVENLSRGKLFDSANSEYFTVIRTGIGTYLLGDAVLYLEDTPCKNILLFGSCGLIRQDDDLSIGSIVVPVECHACESFTQVLTDKMDDCDIFYPDESLFKEFLRYDSDEIARKVHCVTFGSLKMEEEKLHFFGEQGIEAVDMECSALFAASRHIGRRAMAMLYVTDIVGEQPYYESLPFQTQKELISSINQAIDVLCGFARLLK